MRLTLPGPPCETLATAKFDRPVRAVFVTMVGMDRILVVEDDASVAALVIRGLGRAGFEVELAIDGESAVRCATAAPPALVVLDLMLPGRDGLDVLVAIRARCQAPVIVVTARLALEDRLRAFELGAVDYLPKPFFFEELLARVQVRLGRDRPRHVVRLDGALLDFDAPAIEIDGEAVKLTPTELAILRYLVERPGRAVSRADLAQALADPEDPANVEAHVSRLRKKLGDASRHVTTVWGHGYRFEPRPEKKE